MQKKQQRRFERYVGLGREREYLIENLSFLISSGIPIAEALRSIEAELKTKIMKRAVGEARESVENGAPLSRALDDTGFFRPHAISLIKSGEESGTLSENLRVVAEQDAKDRLLRSKLRSALMYPALVLSVTLVVGVGVAWFILPKLATVFSQLHVKLPGITKIFIGIGAFLNAHGLVTLPIFALICLVVVYILFYDPKTRVLGQRILFSVPGIRKLIQELEIARMGYLLGTLSKAGLPILMAIDSLKDSTMSPYYLAFYKDLYASLEQGNSFEKSFRGYKHIRDIMPAAIEQIITVGEQSGNLAEALLRVGRTYEEKVEITTKNLSIALEPLLLVIVWIGVVLVALAVILPIYSLIGGINTGY